MVHSRRIDHVVNCDDSPSEATMNYELSTMNQ